MLKATVLLLLATSLGFAQGVATATIESGQSLSNAVEIRPQGRAGYCTLAAIVMPTNWTTANLTFQGSVDGTNFYNLHDDVGSEVSVVAAASRIIVPVAAYFWGLRWVKVRSGAAGSPVNQTAQRAITLVCRE